MEYHLSSFGNTARHLSRNPLGIIALFIVLVYGMAALVLTTGSLSDAQQYILVWFLVLFPILVLLLFFLLVTRHPANLYAPTDFEDENNYLVSRGIRPPSHLQEHVNRSMENVSEVRETFQDVLKPSVSDTQLAAFQYSNRWQSEDMIARQNRILKNETNILKKNDVTNDLVGLLNFFEELALAVTQGVVDNDLAHDIFALVAIGTWDKYASTINTLRSIWKEPRSYEVYERLVNKWRKA